jgi:hypothetical protein
MHIKINCHRNETLSCLQKGESWKNLTRSVVDSNESMRYTFLLKFLKKKRLLFYCFQSLVVFLVAFFLCEMIMPLILSFSNFEFDFNTFSILFPEK